LKKRAAAGGQITIDDVSKAAKRDAITGDGRRLSITKA